MNTSNKKTELLVGLFLLIGLLMLAGIILQFGRVREAFRKTYSLRVEFTNAPGLKAGSPIFMGGSRIGRVSQNPDLKADSSGVIVPLEIFTDTEIPLESTFSVGSAGLMGDALVEVSIPHSDGPITEFYPKDYEKIIPGNKGSGLSALQSTAESAAKKIDHSLDDLKVALVDVREAMKKVNDSALSDENMKNLSESMEHLRSTMTRVDEKLLGDANAAALSTALEDFKQAAASFKGAAGTVDTQAKRLGGVFDKLDGAVGKLDGVMDGADKSLASVGKAAEEIASLARDLRNGDGLLGALMDDQELKSNFKALIYNLREKGVIWYRDVAEDADADETSSSSSSSRSTRKPFFRR